MEIVDDVDDGVVLVEALVTGLVELLGGIVVAGAAVVEAAGWVDSGTVVTLVLGVVDWASRLDTPSPPQAATDETTAASTGTMTRRSRAARAPTGR